MALAAHFQPKCMTLAQCNEVHEGRATVVQAEPAGRTVHSCFGEDGDLTVHDIWAAPSDADALSQALIPILAEVVVDPGEPAVMAYHLVTQSSTND